MAKAGQTKIRGRQVRILKRKVEVTARIPAKKPCSGMEHLISLPIVAR